MIKLFRLSILFLLSYNTIYSQCYFGESTAMWAHGKSTGVAELDAVLNQENNYLKTSFDINIDLYVGGDEPNNGNAYFSPSCKFIGCTGEIWLGTNLMVELFQKKYGLERLKAVFAHEYAHALQHKMGWAGIGYMKELHADYLAGYYMGAKGNVNTNLLTAFIEEFYERGDDNFFSPHHHGTSEERGCAFLEGFNLAVNKKLNVYQAYMYGLEYVGMKTPCKSFLPAKKYEEVTFDPALYKHTGSLIIKSDGLKSYRVSNLQDQIIAEITKNNFLVEAAVPASKYTFKIYELSLVAGWIYKATITVEVKEDNLLSLNLDSRKIDGTNTLVGKNQSKAFLLGIGEYAEQNQSGAGNFETLYTYFNNAYLTNNKDLNSRFMLGFIEMKKNNFMKALEHFEYLIKNIDNLDYPVFNLANLYSNYSYCLSKLNRPSEANQNISISHEFKSSDPTIDACEAFIRYSEKNYDESLKLYDKALNGMLKNYAENDFQNIIGQLYFERGKVYEGKGDLTRACLDYKEAQKRKYEGAGQLYREICK